MQTLRTHRPAFSRPQPALVIGAGHRAYAPHRSTKGHAMTPRRTPTSEAPRACRHIRREIRAAPALAWRSRPGLRALAYAIGLLVVPLPTVAQTAPAMPGTPRTATQMAESSRPIDAATVSCPELKASVLKSEAGLVIASGPTGGGTFHARAPQCEFWQRSQFTYVMAKEGWCGVGYTCTVRIQGGR